MRAACAAALEDFAAGDATVPTADADSAEHGVNQDSVPERHEVWARRRSGIRRFRTLCCKSSPCRTCRRNFNSRVAWALVDQIGQNAKVTDQIKSWLDLNGTPKLQRIAAQVLAEAMGKETLPWDPHVIEHIEHLLMNLDKPCFHALASLEALATARRELLDVALDWKTFARCAEAIGRSNRDRIRFRVDGTKSTNRGERYRSDVNRRDQVERFVDASSSRRKDTGAAHLACDPYSSRLRRNTEVGIHS